MRDFKDLKIAVAGTGAREKHLKDNSSSQNPLVIVGFLG